MKTLIEIQEANSRKRDEVTPFAAIAKRQKLREALAAIEAKHVFQDEQKVFPTVFERDGKLIVSAEDGGYFADYYGEYRGGYSWIDPRLEEAAKKLGMYWEWENPGCIVAELSCSVRANTFLPPKLRAKFTFAANGKRIAKSAVQKPASFLTTRVAPRLMTCPACARTATYGL